MTDELKAEREAFEKWALETYSHDYDHLITELRNDGLYKNGLMRDLWEAWQARAKLDRTTQAVIQDATQSMCNSVRSLLIAMEQPGRTFGSVRQTCRFAGMDVDNWPHWTVNRDIEHFNKSACAALIWWLMHRSAHATGGDGDE